MLSDLMGLVFAKAASAELARIYGRNLEIIMSERIVKLLIDSFPKILLPGLQMTIPLTVIAFSIAMVIAVIAAMIQYARVPVLRQIMRF